MTDNRPTLLLVDDEPFNLEILEELLGEDYTLLTAENGQVCIDKAIEYQPDLILLDVNMPILNGLLTCEQLKDNIETSDIPVIFISALANEDERIAGYKVGAEDYITKPFHEDELKIKVELVLASLQSKASLQESSTEAMNMAMTAMTSASEVGQILQFVRDSYSAKSYDDLAQITLDLYEAYDLSISIRIITRTALLYFSHTGTLSEREETVFELLHGKGRFIDFGRRTAMNYDNLSIIVNNMPVEDEEKYGRIKDNMGVMGEAIEARTIALENELQLEERKHALDALMVRAEQIIDEIKTEHADNSDKNEQILTDLLEDIEDAFLRLGLSEAQESDLISLLHKAQKDSTRLYDTGLDLDAKLASIKA
ncbi:hypothetical protein A9Q79_08715 [Methylophaga sp. 42_25_T18]|nr:hypothetical protein A9Q79_08715 [Methylophaga sp. 42_25_T18]